MLLMTDAFVITHHTVSLSVHLICSLSIILVLSIYILVLISASSIKTDQVLRVLESTLSNSIKFHPSHNYWLIMKGDISFGMRNKQQTNRHKQTTNNRYKQTIDTNRQTSRHKQQTKNRYKQTNNKQTSRHKQQTNNRFKQTNNKHIDTNK